MQDPHAAPVAASRRPMWRLVLAAILDFITAFVVLGYLVAKATGNTTESGFSLNGLPAIVLFALVVAYFILGNRTGGTLWRRVLGVPPLPRT